MAAGSLPTAKSIKGSATPSFISTFLPTGWHSLSEGRSRDLIATPAPSGAPFGELDENRPLRCRTRWRFAICRDRFPCRQASTDAWGHTARRSAVLPAQSTMVTEMPEDLYQD